MDANLNNILVFATNIQTESEEQKIAVLLNENTSIQQWSIDQEDIDCVLRIVSDTLSAEQLIEMINNFDFECTELK